MDRQILTVSSHQLSIYVELLRFLTKNPFFLPHIHSVSNAQFLHISIRMLHPNPVTMASPSPNPAQTTSSLSSGPRTWPSSPPAASPVPLTLSSHVWSQKTYQECTAYGLCRISRESVIIERLGLCSGHWS